MRGRLARGVVRVLLLTVGLCVLPAVAGSQSPEEPDRLYANRTDLRSATRAAELWRQQTTRAPQNFDAAWKLARATYWLGGHAPEADRRRFFEEGLEAGRAAAALQPQRPEGHFWIAANMGALAESFGVRAGLKYRGPIKDELETVLRLDPTFQDGSADRALGRWYARVPRLFGGNKSRAEEHLRKSLTYNPQSTASHFFLAELLLDDDRRADARAALQAVIDAPLDPEWTPEDLEFKQKARDLLARTGNQLR